MAWRTLGALALLLIAAAFSLGLSAASQGPRLRGAQERQALLGLASLQLGRSLAAFGFVLFGFAPLAGALGQMMGGSSPAWLAAVLLAAALLALLYVLVVLQLAKLVADARGPAVARAWQPLFAFWRRFSYPLSALVVGFGARLRQRLGSASPELRSDALRELLSEEVDVESDQQVRRLLRNVLEFTDAAAGDMMTPRPDVVWIWLGARLNEVLAQVRDSGHTRFPLCDGTPDKVIGYLHARDLVFLRPDSAFDLRKLARPVAFVPETARAMTLLKRFQQERAHVAVVVDEFGGMSGIITLEDILEELVGEIQDEFDVEEIEIRALEGGDLLVDGGAHLDELEASLGLTFGEVEEETLGGYIFGRLAREVRPGDELSVLGALLRVEAVDGLRVTQVRIRLRDAGSEEGVPEALEPSAGSG